MDTWIAILINGGLSFIGVILVIFMTWKLNRETADRARQTALYDAIRYLLDASADIEHVLVNLNGKAAL